MRGDPRTWCFMIKVGKILMSMGLPFFLLGMFLHWMHGTSGNEVTIWFAFFAKYPDFLHTKQTLEICPFRFSA